MTSPKINPEHIAQTVSLYVRAAVRILVSAVIGLASLAAAYIVTRALWLAVQLIQHALGI